MCDRFVGLSVGLVKRQPSYQRRSQDCTFEADSTGGTHSQGVHGSAITLAGQLEPHPTDTPPGHHAWAHVG